MAPIRSIPLPFSDGIQSSDGSITTANGERITHTVSTFGPNQESVTNNYRWGNQEISIEDKPGWQSISVGTTNQDGVYTSYHYSNNEGRINYSINTGGNTPAGTSHGVSQEDFVSGVNTIAGATAQGWTSQLSQVVSGNTGQLQSGGKPSASSSPNNYVHVVTDGVYAIVGNPNDPSHSHTYTGGHEVSSMAINGGYRPASATGTGGVNSPADIRQDSSLINTLPPHVLNEIAQIAASGSAVAVEHVAYPLYPGIPASAPSVSRKRSGPS